MSSPPDSDPPWALTLTNQNAAFAQQGSVDWAKLGELQFSASVAVLGRLAAAGIDPLTLAFGQALCTAIPIGVHGEKVLQSSLQKLKAFSSFGDLIWFGVGVRHILRDLVKTSQGASLVALAAALTEGYNQEVSALVLYELAKCSKAPLDLTPSFSQWKVVVKASSSVLTQSTFGLRVSQIARLAGCFNADQCAPSHPADLAQVILGLGRVVNGSIETIDFIGGGACSWVVAWAGFVLGLRTEMRTSQGNLVYSNFDLKSLQPQARFRLYEDSENTERGICQIGQAIVVRSGRDFIRDCFIGTNGTRVSHSHYEFSRVRVGWESSLETILGGGFRALLDFTDDFSPQLHMCLEDQVPINVFSGFLVALSALLFPTTLLRHRFADLLSFWKWSFNSLPELHSLQIHIIGYTQIASSSLSREQLKSDYDRCRKRLRKTCRCGCVQSYYEEFEDVEWKYRDCIVNFSERVFYLLAVLSSFVFDAPLCPTYNGLSFFFHPQARRNKAEEPELLIQALVNNLEGHFQKGFRLFGGERTELIEDDPNAVGNGKIYAYWATLNGLTDDVAKACMIHIGLGTIQYNSRPYEAVREPAYVPMPRYHSKTRFTTTDRAHFDRDTTQTGLVVNAMVEEKASNLFFWYQVSSRCGLIAVLPAKLAVNLIECIRYHISIASNEQSIQIPNELQEKVPLETGRKAHRLVEFDVFEGEGDLPHLKGGLVVRPLRGNTLGRCIAIGRFGTKHSSPYAVTGSRLHLVKTEDELDQLLNWIGDDEEREDAYDCDTHIIIT